MVTSGPAATNLVTPLCDAYMDSVPMVAITGQVSRPVIGTDGFQECDTVGITRSVTKHNELIMDPDEIPLLVRQAFHLATTGRPGPVLLDVPKDVLQAEMTWSWPTDSDVATSLPGYKPTVNGHPRMIKEAARLIAEARRPVIYAGGGILKSRAAEVLRELAELIDVPVVTTLMARGAFPDDHPLCLGMPGMHGNYTAITAMQQSDLLIALGTRFDDRVTGRVANFAPEARVIHVDIDPAELGKIRRPDVPIVGDCRRVITELVRALQPLEQPDRQEWRSRLSGWQERFPLHYDPPADGDALKPQYVHGGSPRLRTGGHHPGLGRRPASDVGQPVLALHRALYLGELRRAGHHGLLRAGGHRGQGGPPGPHRVGGRWRRLLPDDRPGTGDGVERTHPDQGGHPQQRLSRHGAPVAGDVLPGALQRGVPVARSARLREMGRGHGLHRLPGGGSRGGRPDD